MFHLQPLLKLRGHAEETWRLKLGEASQRSNSLRAQIQALAGERISAFDKTGDNDAGYQCSRALYLGRMEDSIRQLEGELVEAEKTREEVLNEYRKVLRDYEALKKIREKRFAEYRKKWFAEEGREIDDIANSQSAGGVYGEV